MTSTLTHRGPDAEGIWTEGVIALGHRRLSILDLSPAGAQPMLSACERFVMVFNGEIYNHLDLRRDLSKEGAASGLARLLGHGNLAGGHRLLGSR